MKLQWKYWLQTFWAVATKSESQKWRHIYNGYDIMNYFAKFENLYLMV